METCTLKKSGRKYLTQEKVTSLAGTRQNRTRLSQNTIFPNSAHYQLYGQNGFGNGFLEKLVSGFWGRKNAVFIEVPKGKTHSEKYHSFFVAFFLQLHG